MNHSLLVVDRAASEGQHDFYPKLTTMNMTLTYVRKVTCSQAPPEPGAGSLVSEQFMSCMVKMAKRIYPSGAEKRKKKKAEGANKQAQGKVK